MSVQRLFYCTVAGFVVATLLSFLFGASGLLNYRRLQEYERRVAAGIAALEERHSHLERLQTLLRTEPELLRLLAREVGYYGAGELVISVDPPQPDSLAGAASPYAPDFADVGPLVQPRHPLPRDPFNVLALGLFLGLGMFAVLSLKSLFGRRADPAAAADRPGDLPHAVAGNVEDAVAADTWTAGAPAAAGPAVTPAVTPASASAATMRPGGRRRPPVAPQPATAAAAGADAGSRHRRRGPRSRRRDVTVYRL